MRTVITGCRFLFKPLICNASKGSAALDCPPELAKKDFRECQRFGKVDQHVRRCTAGTRDEQESGEENGHRLRPFPVARYGLASSSDEESRVSSLTKCICLGSGMTHLVEIACHQ